MKGREIIKHAAGAFIPDMDRLKEDVIRQADTYLRIAKNRRKHIMLRPLLIGAVIIALSFTTAFATNLPEIIRGLIVRQEEAHYIMLAPNRYWLSGVTIIDSDYIDYGEPVNIRKYAELDDLRRETPFTVNGPLFLPENAELSQIYGFYYMSDRRIYTVDLFYEYPIPDAIGGRPGMVFFSQLYIGPGAVMEVVTYDFVEPVTINGGEGFFISVNPELYLQDNNEFIYEQYKILYWHNEGFVYGLSSIDVGLDMETMIAIAESVG